LNLDVNMYIVAALLIYFFLTGNQVQAFTLPFMVEGTKVPKVLVYQSKTFLAFREARNVLRQGLSTLALI